MPTKKSLAILSSAIRTTQEELMDFLKSKHPGEVLTIEAVRGFMKGKEDVQIFAYVRDSIFPYSLQIKNRNLDFFKESKNVVFKGLPQKYIDHYADLILSCNKDDIEQIFTYFQKLVEIYEVSLARKKNK